MPIYVYGMNHRSAPLELRERVAFPEEEVGAAVGRLVSTGPVKEGLLLSTCNRTEILVHGTDAGAPAALKQFLVDERRVSGDDLERHCYLLADGEAVRHVFRVASSLDSMILGEAQILGQLKDAYSAAVAAHGLGTILDTLMQRSFGVAKRVRAETGIARHPVSIAHAAAGLARDIFGDLRDKAILILGAGEMARVAATHLIGDGVASVVVANRSYQNGARLAQELGGRAVPFEGLFGEMESADIVIASTAAPVRVVRYEDAQRASRARRGRPLFFIDIAVPRDVDPRVNEIDNVYVYDIDDLQALVRANMDGRQQEAALAETIVTRETAAYQAWLRSLEVVPMIVGLQQRMRGLGESEILRFRARLGPLSAEQWKALAELAESLVNKCLHHPIRALKRAAADGGGDRLSILREALGMGPGAGGVEEAPDGADRPMVETHAAPEPRSRTGQGESGGSGGPDEEDRSRT